LFAAYVMYRKCRPSGRNTGHPLAVMPLAASLGTLTFVRPPAAGTSQIGSLPRPSKRMTPSELHEPSDPVAVSQIVCGGPPVMSTFFNFPPPVNATILLSGDQNRRTAPSVPGSGCGSRTSSGRTQTCDLPSRSVATNAILRPSGETSGDDG